MLIVRNDDRIGMVAAVATILATAGLNISDLKLGRTGDGKTAMMALSFSEPVPPSVVDALCAEPGILDAAALADL
jgi:D-3-phosphoglycerate dehydrogenase / 2-oxoglutarate reductase